MLEIFILIYVCTQEWYLQMHICILLDIEVDTYVYMCNMRDIVIELLAIEYTCKIE